MQEAQSSVLAKEDELAALKQELQTVKAQQSVKAQQRDNSESDSAQAQAWPGQHSAAGTSGRAQGGLHSRANVAQGRAVADSGLPSPSLPATPHSPAGSPQGELLSVKVSPGQNGIQHCHSLSEACMHRPCNANS